MPAAGGGGTEVLEAVEPQSLKKLSLKSLKRAVDVFAPAHGDRIGALSEGCKIRITCKVNDEYAVVKDMPVASTREGGGAKPGDNGLQRLRVPASEQHITNAGPAIMLHSFIDPASAEVGGKQLALVPAQSQTPATAPVVGAAPAAPTADRASTAITTTDRYQPSAAVMKRLPSKWPKPVWHPPWVNYRKAVHKVTRRPRIWRPQGRL